MGNDWQSRLTSERMQVDQEFDEQIAASEFSRQQFGLIMTAVEFDIERPDDPDRARLIADTDKLSSIMGELDRLDDAGAVPGAGGGGGGGSGGSGGGLLGSIKSALGFDDSDARREAAEKLAQDYADRVQVKLEERGKWERILVEASDS